MRELKGNRANQRFNVGKKGTEIFGQKKSVLPFVSFFTFQLVLTAMTGLNKVLTVSVDIRRLVLVFDEI